jgi:hypothetical protein
MSPEQARAQQIDGRSDIYSLGIVAYQCLSGLVPYDGEDSFSIGYKHIMEELPVPPLETQEQKDLFEVIRKMLAKAPDERFQTADELVEVLESVAGYVATGISTAQTRSIPSLGFPRLSKVASAATTPLPRSSASLSAIPLRRGRSIAAGLTIWMLAVAAILGGGGFLAYKKGLIFGHSAVDSSAVPPPDSARLAADSLAADSARRATGGGVDTTAGTRPAPGTPGKLVLQGTIPLAARVTMNGQPVRGSQLDLPPGTHKLEVRATGYMFYERQVLIAPGGTVTLPVVLQRVRPPVDSGVAAGGGGGTARSCDRYEGPTYNQDGGCFDTRPTPLTAPFIFLAPDAEMPRRAILLVHVSADGTTVDVRPFSPSNVESFNIQAQDLASNLRWSPALKDGDPVEAWVQLQVLPQRQQ